MPDQTAPRSTTVLRDLDLTPLAPVPGDTFQDVSAVTPEYMASVPHHTPDQMAFYVYASQAAGHSARTVDFWRTCLYLAQEHAAQTGAAPLRA